MYVFNTMSNEFADDSIEEIANIWAGMDPNGPPPFVDNSIAGKIRKAYRIAKNIYHGPVLGRTACLILAPILTYQVTTKVMQNEYQQELAQVVEAMENESRNEDLLRTIDFAILYANLFRENGDVQSVHDEVIKIFGLYDRIESAQGSQLLHHSITPSQTDSISGLIQYLQREGIEDSSFQKYNNSTIIVNNKDFQDSA